MIGLGVPILAFVGLVIYEMTIGLPKSPPKEVKKSAVLPSKSPLKTLPQKSSSAVLPPKPTPKEVKKPTACVFTRDPVETWPDETVNDPPIGNVELIKKSEIKTFDVFGSNIREVLISIGENGPVQTTGYGAGKRGAASLAAGFGYRWFTKDTADGCILTRASAIIDITLKLPNWVDEASATIQDQKMWDLYQKFVKRHEQGHINIALKAAREFQAELAQPQSAPSCPELGDKINVLLEAAKQKKTEDNADYHKRTDFGNTQVPHESTQTKTVFPFTCNWSEINI